MSVKRSANAIEAHTATVTATKKAKGDNGQPITPSSSIEHVSDTPPSSADTPIVSTATRKKAVPSTRKTKQHFPPRVLFVILCRDNYVPSNTEGVSATYGTRSFPEVLKLYNEKFNSNAKSTQAVQKHYDHDVREIYCSENPDYPRKITYTEPPPSALKTVKSVQKKAGPTTASLQAIHSRKLADLQQLKAKLEEIMEFAVDKVILALAKRNLVWVEATLASTKADIKGNYGRMRAPTAVRNAADINNYFTYGTNEQDEKLRFVVDDLETESESGDDETASVACGVESESDSDDEESDEE